jgi:TonB family protein
MPRRHVRIGPLALSLVFPAALFFLLDARLPQKPNDTEVQTVELFIPRRVVVDRFASNVTAAPRIRVPVESIPVVVPDLQLEVTEEVLGLGRMVAHPTARIDPAMIGAAAGLLAGEQATVVLRVEILPSGEVGQVVTELSSGSRAVDAAVEEYVRTLNWVAGRADGRPEAQWIRWGIQLLGDSSQVQSRITHAGDEPQYRHA